MTEDPGRSVRRVLERDDLLTMAAAADEAVDIVRSRQTMSRPDEEGKTLFDIALERQLRAGETNVSESMKSQAWDYAAVLLHFCEMVGMQPDVSVTAQELHVRALAAVRDDDPELDLDWDMLTGAFNRYHAARQHRLCGRFDQALALVDRPVSDLYGSGAEPRTGHYLYEIGATYIQLGQSAQISAQLAEMDNYYQKNARASGHSTRYRLDFIRALAHWDATPNDPVVRRQLATAVDRLQTTPTWTDDSRAESVRELSLRMATAEYLAAQSSPEDHTEALRHCLRALEIADSVRARWHVLARSRAPLAQVFERVYGDLALLACRLHGPDAATLGFRVAVSAKQTGFAIRIRDGRTFAGNENIDSILRSIVEIEGAPLRTSVDTPEDQEKNLRKLRRRLIDEVSPMLEDTVFPAPLDLADLVQRIGPRYALDFVELHDTLDNIPHLFRTLIEPGGRISFDLCSPDPASRQFLESGKYSGDLARGIARAARDTAPEADAPETSIDWRQLAKDVLPHQLTAVLLADTAEPARILVSAHSWLSLVPWAALKIDDLGVRLVQRAVISQTPILTCLAEDLPPQVTGRALIRLVGRDEGGVNVDLERRAWGFPAGTDGVPPHRCELLPDERPAPWPERFGAALQNSNAWQFVHVASHGDGKGFEQHLVLPDQTAKSSQLSAASALGLSWPTSVLMASCHVGQVINDNGAEPLSFVLAVLTGGARCVVAGIDQIDDDGTGFVASHIVRAVRGGRVSLEVALRNAQLAAIKDEIGEKGWALLSAYVR